ncbi:hypothetical protein BN7874_026 [Phage NCTB]|nr:hypothetical protein BN7874_026 [Phage NCTB]
MLDRYDAIDKKLKNATPGQKAAIDYLRLKKIKFVSVDEATYDTDFAIVLKESKLGSTVSVSQMLDTGKWVVTIFDGTTLRMGKPYVRVSTAIEAAVKTKLPRYKEPKIILTKEQKGGVALRDRLVKAGIRIEHSDKPIGSVENFLDDNTKGGVQVSYVGGMGYPSLKAAEYKDGTFGMLRRQGMHKYKVTRAKTFPALVKLLKAEIKKL